MQIKLFGKNLFEFNTHKSNRFLLPAEAHNKESKFLPDFQRMNGSGMSFGDGILTNATEDFVFAMKTPNSGVAIPVTKGAKKTVVEAPKKKTLTPKGVHELKMLNDEGFKINTDPIYVEKQIANFKDKLALINATEWDMRRGTEEIASILIRMEARKKYNAEESFFSQFPYTTNSKIEAVLKEHDYLKLGQVEQFIADLPDEATQAMKEYNVHTNNVSGKQAIYYIIADKKDFKQTNSRRDPILLAQSPFGHVWQILGAWDKEMLFLEEL